MIYIGTSGFSYDDWVGPYYPRGTPKGEFLAHYAREFPCTEVNATYYAIPSAGATRALARRGSHAALRLLEIPELSRGFDFIWIGPERFDAAKAFFRRHADHGYSFTDCTSFVVMREFDLTDALTTDRHFREAGFKPLLPVA